MSSHKKHRKKLEKCPYEGCDYVPSNQQCKEKHLMVHMGFKPYLCTWPKCGYRVLRKAHLKDHVQHVHQKVYSFACHVCYQPGFPKSEIRAHLLLHEDEGHKMDECDFCGWTLELTLIQSPAIRRKSSDAESPALVIRTCHVCCKRFSKPGALKYHLTVIHEKKLGDHHMSDCETCKSQHPGWFSANGIKQPHGSGDTHTGQNATGAAEFDGHGDISTGDDQLVPAASQDIWNGEDVWVDYSGEVAAQTEENSAASDGTEHIHAIGVVNEIIGIEDDDVEQNDEVAGVSQEDPAGDEDIRPKSIADPAFTNKLVDAHVRMQNVSANPNAPADPAAATALLRKLNSVIKGLAKRLPVESDSDEE